MFLQRSTVAIARRAATTLPVRRAFTTALPRRSERSSKDASLGPAAHQVPATGKSIPNIDRRIEDIDNETDLMPEGAEIGTVPTDVEQATGLERLEILGKMQGIDIFDMKPLPSDRLGTLKDPIMVRSFGEEQYCGCTGCPADSHNVKWITISRDRPLGRCCECGSCYMMEYVGPDHVHAAERTEPSPQDFSHFIKPEYYYR